MDEVATVHARARFTLVTCDPRHASWRVGYTIRVVQGLHGSTLCAFHQAFPAEFIFRGLPNSELAEELILKGPDELYQLLQRMTAERYADLLTLQHAAARRCLELGRLEDPIALLVEDAREDTERAGGGAHDLSQDLKCQEVRLRACGE